MASVPASDYQKNFGECMSGSIRSGRDYPLRGRPTPIWCLPRCFRQLWERFPPSNMPVEALSIGEVEAIMQAK